MSEATGVSPDHKIDPELLASARRLVEPDLLAREHIPVLRQRGAAMNVVDPESWPDVSVSDHEIAVIGAPPVAIRSYRWLGPSLEGLPTPSHRSALPAVVEVHGGAFVLGDLDMMDVWCRAVASMAQCQVFSVGYRLAPEDPFPAGFDDCYAVLEWVARDAASLGVDPERIALVGQSAGGGLAAAVALAARDRSGPSIRFQMLEMPQLDDRLQTASSLDYTNTPAWTRANAELSWAHYLGPASGGDVSPYAAPGRATDLRGLPPTYISVAQFDPLRDEAMAYAQRLLEASVPVELHVFSGTFHGSSRVPTAEVSRRMALEAVTVLRRALHHPLPGGEMAPDGTE